MACLRGYCTQEEYNLAVECKHHIEECEMELRKHKVMTAIDFTGLVVSGTVDVEEIKYQSIPSLSCMLKQLHLYN